MPLVSMVTLRMDLTRISFFSEDRDCASGYKLIHLIKKKYLLTCINTKCAKNYVVGELCKL